MEPMEPEWISHVGLRYANPTYQTVPESGTHVRKRGQTEVTRVLRTN